MHAHEGQLHNERVEAGREKEKIDNRTALKEASSLLNTQDSVGIRHEMESLEQRPSQALCHKLEITGQESTEHHQDVANAEAVAKSPSQAAGDGASATEHHQDVANSEAGAKSPSHAAGDGDMSKAVLETNSADVAKLVVSDRSEALTLASTDANVRALLLRVRPDMKASLGIPEEETALNDHPEQNASS